MSKPKSDSTNDELYATLLGCAEDARGRNARYCQNQLFFLHRFLRENVDLIRSAITRDTQGAQAEVDTQIALSLAAVRKLYDEIDFHKNLANQTRISRKQDHPEARIPYGIALIRPTVHTRFFSIVSAIAAAFAAGNVVLLELKQSLSSVDAFFRNDFRTFDREAFGIATTRVENADFLSKCLVVDQAATAVAGADTLTHRHGRPVLAVIDRTADLTKAARAIVKSKCLFQGTSPHAIDIVLINEWIRKEFLAQCQEAIKMEMPAVKRKIGSHGAQDKCGKSEEILLEIEGFTVSELHSIEELHQRKSSVFHMRLVTATGLVDAVSMASKVAPLSVLYCFSAPPEARFVGEQIESQLFLVNQVPQCLLIGPSLPVSSCVHDLALRYDTHMMSKPAPQLITDLDPSLDSLLQEEMMPLKPFKQGSGFDIGFFQRGILVGAVTIVLPTICTVIYAASRGVIYGYRRWSIS